MAAEPDVSIIVVSWNTRDLLIRCVRSVYDTAADLEVEVFVVDNASSDGSASAVRERFPQVKLIENARNLGFVGASNQAMARARGRYLLLLNSDAELLEGSIARTIDFMDRHPEAGIAGARLLSPDGSFQASYTPFPTLWTEFLTLSGLGRLLLHPEFPSRGPDTEEGARLVNGYVEGAYLMARREAMEEVGGLDKLIFMYAEDVDWCYRFHQASWQIWYLPEVSIVHHGGQSSRCRPGRSEAELYRSRVYFFRKHYGMARGICLEALIYGLTLPKIVIHRLLVHATRGRRGRTVTSWRDLRVALARPSSITDW